MFEYVRNFLSRGTWWKHLIVLTPLAYYGRYVENDLEKVMLAAVGYVAFLIIEKVYEKNDPPPSDEGINVYPE